MSITPCVLPQEPPRALLSYVHPGMYSVANKKRYPLVLDSKYLLAAGKNDRENYRKAYEFARDFFQENGSWNYWNGKTFRQFAEGLNCKILGKESRYRDRGAEVTYVMKDADAPAVVLAPEPQPFIDYLRKKDRASIAPFMDFYLTKSPAFAKELRNSDAMDPIGDSKVLPAQIKNAMKKYIRLCPSNSTVPGKMASLFRDFQESLKNADPIKSAALLHTGFVGIHPFDDGNGREARMMMNFALMLGGFPPLFFASEREYDQEVAKAVETEPKPFAQFLRAKMKDLQDTMAKAPKEEDPYTYAEQLPLRSVVPVKSEGPQRRTIQICVALAIIAILAEVYRRNVDTPPLL